MTEDMMREPAASGGAADFAPAQTAPASTAPTDWRNAFPADWSDRLGQVDSAEDAARALERGLAYTPALRPEDVDLHYPEGVRVDEGVAENFRRFCVDRGITPDQAQALVDWQISANSEIAEAALAAGLSPAQVGLITEEDQGYVLKSKLVEFWRGLEGKLD